MKHLRYFKSKKEDYHMQVVKDVFQDIIDDYDLYEKKYGSLDTTGGGDFYTIGYRRVRTKDVVFIKIWHLNADGVFEKSEKLSKINFVPYVKRLEDMGYGIWVSELKREFLCEIAF